MPVIRSFRELKVYRAAIAEAKRVFVLSKSFPREERYSLTDQIRRSSRAVAAMIAEAWARRRYPAAFSSKLDEALAEASETQAWLDHALEAEYITAAVHGDHDQGWQSIGGMLHRMIEKADQFCDPASGRGR